ncbi:hypothetical protein GC105_16105 [Alkalibaculum sp. M08DMB]|uniref:Uncharacterized protein n=1 Tax=Alkalibaculum sporogenes TaxID=2655001 RepID=A0A6A7KCN4_9FIRM|nr:hypothetical protein [Alkalibaculum sporogenes]MPW27290.1 hypothetical protein [Alkalibaculum sporogenes]
MKKLKNVKENKEEAINCDTVVLSLSVRADSQYIEIYEDCVFDVIAIGDCNTRQVTLYNAAHTGYAARTINY